MVLGPILAFYLLVDLPKLSRTARGGGPGRAGGARSSASARRVSAAVGGYFRGQLIVAVLVGACCMLGFWLIALPYWALVGLLIGLFSLIPLIGPFLGAIPALFVAFTSPASGTGGLFHPRPGWPLAVAASVVLLIVQTGRRADHQPAARDAEHPAEPGDGDDLGADRGDHRRGCTA